MQEVLDPVVDRVVMQQDQLSGLKDGQGSSNKRI